ncbi:hypothetical protein R50072_00730 [Simiduia litorea]|uniref:copper resistance protein B n=1 Tax=Simiduia litorea TaxID=1435348 RepID=UPI0036F2E63F
MRIIFISFLLFSTVAFADSEEAILSGEFDLVEWRSQGVGLWDGEIFLGNAADNALVFKTSAALFDERENAHEIQLLGQTGINDSWVFRAGVRADSYPEPTRNWGVISFTGETESGTALEATAFANDANQSLLLGAEHFFEITPRLKLIPKAELTFFGNDDIDTSIGEGLSTLEVGLRLRYIVNPVFKPYVGINWINSYGRTRDILDAELSRTQNFNWRAGFTLAF